MIRTFLSLLLLLMSPAYGEDVNTPVDVAVEKRMLKLSEELRCLVCQNQSLADSESGLAGDLRREIRTMIVQGKNDKEIVDFLVQRYGDFVRYRPPVKSTTVLLWFGPFALLAVAGTALYLRVKRRKRQLVDAPLTNEERARVSAVLNEHAGKKG